MSEKKDARHILRRWKHNAGIGRLYSNTRACYPPVYYLPLIYTFGATEGGKPFVFNNSCEYGSATMTGFAFGIGDK
ncbi:hypothetical protein [Synergistes jonesii]|uniref:hypothetical protein n=1 Tax=Synergistes jonesii TaxID=2754 RepID=UPI00248EBBEC|nr:hypothetical protein [Synergistes jonesii]